MLSSYRFLALSRLSLRYKNNGLNAGPLESISNVTEGLITSIRTKIDAQI